MGAFNSAVITKKGQSLLTKVVHGSAKLSFTQIKISENVLKGDLTNLTNIGTVKQAEKVASVAIQNNYNIKVSASFSNRDITAGYYIRNIGLYAMDPTEGEILYSISVADESTATADWMPPYNNIGVSSLMVDLITAVSNAESVNTEVDPTANATVAQLNEVKEHLTALDNSITTTTERALRGSVAGGLKITKVCGKSEQYTTTGKNFVPSILATETVQGVTYTLNGDRTILVNGTATAYASVSGKLVDVPELAGKTVVLLGTGKGTNVVTQIRTFNANGDHLGNITCNDMSYAQHTLSSDVAKVQFECYVATGKTASNVKIYPYLAIYEGMAISAENYEPYSGGIPAPNPDYPQEIRSVEVSKIVAYGRNLFDKNSVTDNKSVVMSTGELYSDESSVASDYIFVNGISALEHSHKASNEDGTALWGACYDENKNYISAIGNSYDKLSIPAGAHYIRVGVHKSFVDFFTLSIDEKTPYEPYKESIITLSQPVTLNGIGEVRDELTPNGVIRKFAKVILNGSESWGVFNTDMAGIYRRKTTSFVDNIKEAGLVLSDKYNSKTSTETYQRKEGVSVDLNKNVIIYDEDFNAQDSSSWANHLAENPITLYYELANPVVEPLPTADQIALRSLVCHDGVTNLVTDSGVAPIIEADYGTNKLGAHTLTGLLTAQRNELKLAELATD